MTPPDELVLALVGPTATGKTQLAVRLAREAPFEVVALDAITLYRGMDAATAKPSPAHRAEVRHHLLDVLDPWEEATAAWFQTEARRVVTEVRDRGNQPLLVGGSGLYFRAVVDPLEFPPTDPDVRARLEARFAGDPTAAHTALTAIDPAAAAKIDPANIRRSIRALEVIELTGRKFSSYADEWQRRRSVYPSLVVHGLDDADQALRDRIGRRAADMVGAGLLDEAERLRALPTPLSRTARQAIGYAEALAVLDGTLDQADLIAAITSRTWRYVRRQRSWFRRDPRIRWSTPDDVLREVIARQR